MIEHWKNLSLENIVEEIDGIVYTEEWMPIKRFKKAYSISTFGRVKSHKRKCYHKRKSGTKYITEVKEKILRHKFNNRRYHIVSLSGYEKPKYLLVHRLVGLHFIQNPENKRTVNHRFGIKKDNRVWFLEWATDSEQGLHSFRKLGRVAAKTNLGKFGKDHNKSIPVLQYDLDGNFIKEWENAQEVQRELGISSSNVSLASLGKSNNRSVKSAGGFMWRRSKNGKLQTISPCDNRSKKIIQLTKNGQFIRQFSNLTEAGNETGLCRSHIGKSCKNGKLAYNFKWAYA